MILAKNYETASKFVKGLHRLPRNTVASFFPNTVYYLPRVLCLYSPAFILYLYLSLR